MRTDYSYEDPKPTEDEEKALIDFSVAQGGPFLWERVLATGDAPPLVLEYAKRRRAAYQDWEDGAKDRPYTRRLADSAAYDNMRLFDGRWFDPRAVPPHIEANYLIESKPICFSAEDFGRPPAPHEQVYERHIETVWPTYDKLIQADDEEGCRRMAAAIYEYLELGGRRARLLCDAGRLARRRLELWERRIQGTFIDPAKEPELATGEDLDALAHEEGLARQSSITGRNPETDAELRERLLAHIALR